MAGIISRILDRAFAPLFAVNTVLLFGPHFVPPLREFGGLVIYSMLAIFGWGILTIIANLRENHLLEKPGRSSLWFPILFNVAIVAILTTAGVLAFLGLHN